MLFLMFVLYYNVYLYGYLLIFQYFNMALHLYVLVCTKGENSNVVLPIPLTYELFIIY